MKDFSIKKPIKQYPEVVQDNVEKEIYDQPYNPEKLNARIESKEHSNNMQRIDLD